MKLLHKLAPVAIVASATAAVVPFVTSCGQGWTSFSARDFDEDKYTQHEEVTGGWDVPTIWNDFGKSKVAFDTDIRFYTNFVYKMLNEKLIKPVNFPKFDIKYRNFKAELDSSNTPFVSYDIEVDAEYDTLLKRSNLNAPDYGRYRAKMSLSMKHVPVLVNYDTEQYNTWVFVVDFGDYNGIDYWTEESNLYYTSNVDMYLVHENKEYYRGTQVEKMELNKDVGHWNPGDEYLRYLSSMGSYYYQKVEAKK